MAGDCRRVCARSASTQDLSSYGTRVHTSKQGGWNMKLNTSKCCRPARALTALGVGAILAATALTAQNANAQTCGATMQPTLSPPDTIFAVGQGLTINLTFGPTAANGGSMSISTVTVRLDCENSSGCDIGNPCVDDS